MTLKVGDADASDQDEWIDNWSIDGRPAFIDSDAFGLLQDELRRYVRHRSKGRSFLIAGHRGAGKTTLATHAIEDLDRDILRKAWDLSRKGQQPPWSGPRQRPLMVRLHGPSLLATSSGEGASTGTPDMAAVLEHVMVALYRALAGEAGRCMRSLAKERAKESGGRSAEATGVVEAAAQFILDLDNAPKPALLRAYYERLGCLRQGIFWPLRVAEAMGQGGASDQGMRELLALATAAQAFEVCAGEVKSSDTTSTARSRGTVTELKVDASLAEVLNKALGIAAGLAVGAATAAAGVGMAWAAVSGVAVSIVTAATYSRSTKSSTSGERRTDYTFIRDRTKRSLDRDLPGVVQRIRDAGLAPVFVVDELDKLTDPDVAIAGFIGSVKHLTTDFGAFCFLTDRSYFERVSGKVGLSPYPLEHTFFSHWLLVLHDTDDLLDYLADIIVSDIPPPVATQETGAHDASATAPPVEDTHASARAADALSRPVLALYLVHRSKLNAVDLFREIGRVQHRHGGVRAIPDAIGSSSRHRFGATFQLAVRAILRRPPLRDRIAAEPAFARLATDALYMPSRAWEAGRADVVLTRAAIAAELSERCVPRHGRDESMSTVDPPHPEGPASGLTQHDLDLLEEQVVSLVDLLSDLKALVEAPEAALCGTLVGDPSTIVPLELTGALVERVEDCDRRFRFVFDSQGQDVRLRESLATDDGLGETLQEIPQQIADVEAFLSILSGEGLGLADFIAAGILPPAMDPDGLAGARDRLRIAIADGRSYPSQVNDIQLMRIAATVLDRRLPGISDLLHLLVEVAVAAGSSDGSPVRSPLEAVARFLDLSDLFGHDHAASPQPLSTLPEIIGRPSRSGLVLGDSAPTGRAKMLDAIVVSLARQRLSLSVDLTWAESASRPDRADKASWERWASLLISYAQGSGHLADPPAIKDMATRAAGLAPGSLFRRDLEAMTVAEWSQLYLRGFPPGRHAVPSWVYVVGLWGLGFGRDLLKRAASLSDPDGVATDLLRALIAKATPEHVRGLVLVMSDDATSLGGRSERRPEEYGHPADSKIIAIRQHELGVYSKALAWLAERDALEGLVYEQ